jgi:hypothetical protein
MRDGIRRSWRARFKRVVAAPLIFVAAVIILFEEWLWDDLSRLAAAIGRLPVLRGIEALIVRLPPYGALACFGAPALLLAPVKIAALYFISHGRATAGLATIIFAKVAGTALVARIFTLTRPKLMHIAWFAWCYERFMKFKARIHEAIHSTRIYRIVHARYLRFRTSVRELLARRKSGLRRRWVAALKLSRRRRQTET